MESGKERNSADPFVEKLLAHQAELTRFLAAALAAMPERVEDVVQETNLALLRRKDLYDASRPFMPWLIAHAKTQAMAALKRSTRERLVFDNVFLEAIAQEASSEPDDTPLLTRLRICRAKLKPEQRELLAMRYDREMPLEEICRKTRRTNIAVRSELSYLRRKLAGCVRQKCALPETSPAFDDALSRAVEGLGSLPSCKNAQQWLDEFGFAELLRRYRAYPAKKTLWRKWHAAALFAAFSAIAATATLKSLSAKTEVSATEHSSLSTSDTQVFSGEELSEQNTSLKTCPAETSSAGNARGDEMKPKTTWLAAALSIFGAASQATEYRMSASDGKPNASNPNTSFNSIGKWIGATTGPSAGNEYLANYTLRTPYSASATTFTFGGDKLTIANWFGSDSASGSSIVINNCHFYGAPRLCINNDGRMAQWRGETWTLDANAQLHVLLSGKGEIGHRIYAPFTGDSSTSIIYEFTSADANVKQVLLFNSCPEFRGRSYIRSTIDPISVPGSLAYVHAFNEDSFGAQPDTFQKDWLTISGGSLRCETDWNGTNRGIWIAAEGSYPARATFIEAAGKTRTLPNQIGGSGDIYKTGGGTLKLTGKLAFTGTIHATAGILQIATAEDVACAEIESSSEGVIGLLTDSYVEKVTVGTGGFTISGAGANVGELSFAKDVNISVNSFSSWSEGTPLIKATRKISIAEDIYLHIYGTGTELGKEIILLEAPVLENIDVGNIIFDDYTMTLSKTSANGLERIVATPNPVAYLTSGDSAGQSAFTRADKWNPAVAPNSTEGAAYVYAHVNNNLLRTPERAVETFGGKRLVLGNYRLVGLKSANGCVVPNFMVFSGTLVTSAETTWLSGELTTVPNSSGTSLTINHTINDRVFNFGSNLRGGGAVTILFCGDPEYTTELGRVNLLGDNSKLHAGFNSRGNSNGVTVVSSAVSIPQTVGLWGAGFGADRDTVMPSTVKLSMEMGDVQVATSNDAGQLHAGYGTLPGGGNIWALNGATFTIEPAITASGSVNRPLRTHGRDGGKVVLSGDNSGIKSEVELVEGSTVAANPNALGSGDVTIRSGATLALPYPLPENMPNGVNVSGTIAIEDGAKITLEIASGATLSSGTRVPLFLLPQGHSMTAADFSMQKPGGIGNLAPEVSIEGRQVYATFSTKGTVVMLLGGN